MKGEKGRKGREEIERRTSDGCGGRRASQSYVSLEWTSNDVYVVGVYDKIRWTSMDVELWKFFEVFGDADVRHLGPFSQKKIGLTEDLSKEIIVLIGGNIK